MRVNEPENFKGRVAHAAQVISEGRPTNRTFDSCFENSDGDEVATILYRRAQKNPKLAKNIWNYLSKTSVTKAAEQLAHVSTRDMPEQARKSRAESQRQFQKLMDERS